MNKKPIVMSHKDFVKEHIKLVKVLKHGTKKQLKEEAREQGNELKKKR